MEPPAKRLRILKSVDVDEDSSEYIRKKREAEAQLKNQFESIFAKYENMPESMTDEVDMVTGTVVVDRGHLRSLQNQPSALRAANFLEDLLVDSAEPGAINAGHEDYEDDTDELAPPESLKKRMQKTTKTGTLGQANDQITSIPPEIPANLSSNIANTPISTGLVQHAQVTQLPASMMHFAQLPPAPASLTQLAQLPPTPENQLVQNNFLAAFSQTMVQAVHQAFSIANSMGNPSVPNCSSTPFAQPYIAPSTTDAVAPATNSKWYFPPLPERRGQQISAQSTAIPNADAVRKRRVPFQAKPIRAPARTVESQLHQNATDEPTISNEGNPISDTRFLAPKTCRRVNAIYVFSRDDDAYIVEQVEDHNVGWEEIRRGRSAWKHWPLTAIQNRYENYLRGRNRCLGISHNQGDSRDEELRGADEAIEVDDTRDDCQDDGTVREKETLEVEGSRSEMQNEDSVIEAEGRSENDQDENNRKSDQDEVAEGEKETSDVETQTTDTSKRVSAKQPQIQMRKYVSSDDNDRYSLGRGAENMAWPEIETSQPECENWPTAAPSHLKDQSQEMNECIAVEADMSEKVMEGNEAQAQEQDGAGAELNEDDLQRELEAQINMVTNSPSQQRQLLTPHSLEYSMSGDNQKDAHEAQGGCKGNDTEQLWKTESVHQPEAAPTNIDDMVSWSPPPDEVIIPTIETDHPVHNDKMPPPLSEHSDHRSRISTTIEMEVKPEPDCFQSPLLPIRQASDKGSPIRKSKLKPIKHTLQIDPDSDDGGLSLVDAGSSPIFAAPKKPFPCLVCGKLFRLTKSLLAHEMGHGTVSTPKSARRVMAPPHQPTTSTPKPDGNLPDELHSSPATYIKREPSTPRTSLFSGTPRRVPNSAPQNVSRATPKLTPKDYLKIRQSWATGSKNKNPPGHKAQAQSLRNKASFQNQATKRLWEAENDEDSADELAGV
ncbi:hypothetical protein K504DRAFT_37328 [Pleomassaria siparia CBS 279.74]|uniref:C2H2-type domain-containing protein n=1 Tax=Pleomassaria siparia CBS 279.74 TaxID=1314801 RepID=A0A6G1K432_9PLEO|nr:hypothetical protein K504DRAFT_37328 [Pleomassaria siparia CBS 279.74]